MAPMVLFEGMIHVPNLREFHPLSETSTGIMNHPAIRGCRPAAADSDWGNGFDG